MEVKLKYRQIDHVEKLNNILDNNFYCLDLSSMGSGKTHIISKIVQMRKINNVFIVCPKSVIPTWEKAAILYNLPILDNGIITYESFKTDKPNGLLKINTIETEKFFDKIYSTTKKLDTLIKDGCIFIFDEFQKSKNENTSTYIACKTLILRVKYFFELKYSNSKIILSTGTIIDKEIQASGFMKLVGIQTIDKLYYNTKGTFQYDKYGFMEILKYCESLDKIETKKALKEGSTMDDGTTLLCKETIYKVIYMLFYRVVLKFFSSTMELPCYPVPIDIKNGYYNLSDIRTKKLNIEITKLKDALFYSIKDGTIFSKYTILDYDDNEDNNVDITIGAISTYLKNIEFQKLEIIIREAITILESNKNIKVPIILNYINNINIVYKILEKYNPLVLTGKNTQSERKTIIEKFNEQNNNHRVYIGQLIASSSGIELDDKSGNFPRYPLISPNYSAIASHQVNYRFYRCGTSSIPVIRYIYAKNAILEKSILNAYQKKSNILKTISEINNIKYPGDYEEYIEEKYTLPYFKYKGYKIVINDDECLSDTYKTLSTLIDEMNNSK